MAVEPSLMASKEYSTWNRRPSGEKVLKKNGQADAFVSYSFNTYLIPRSALVSTGIQRHSALEHYHILSGL